MKGIRIFSANWRETARGVRLGFMNAYVVFPMFLFLLHIRWWSFFLFAGTAIVMTVIEHLGFTPPVAILAVRAWMAGKLIKLRKSMFEKSLED